MKAAAYLRVSSISQVDGYSLDAQESLFRELCKNRGWELTKIYREEVRFAHIDSVSRRPVFRQLLDDASRKIFDIIIVLTPDRWAQNHKVMLDSRSILAKANVSLVSINDNNDYSTPHGN